MSARRSLTLLVTIATSAFLGCAATALAAVGVGTDLALIRIAQPVHAGSTVHLQQFAIINTGDQTMGYELHVAAAAGTDTPVPAAWVTFSPSGLYLSPQRGTRIAATLYVPADAAPGTYAAQLVGKPMATVTQGGAVVGIATGPLLRFEVIPPGVWRRAQLIFTGWMPWSALAVALTASIAGLLAWLCLRRRSWRHPADSVPRDEVDQPSSRRPEANRR